LPINASHPMPTADLPVMNGGLCFLRYEAGARWVSRPVPPTEPTMMQPDRFQRAASQPLAEVVQMNVL
jgi:hypothetical protein